MGALDCKHAVVTGAGSGIGAAIAKTLAQAGAAVTLSGRRREPLEAVAAQLPRTHVATADVTDEAAVAALFDSARDAFGPVDIVIANAGAAESAPIASVDLDAWRRMIDVNLTGAFLTARAGLADMTARGWGRLIFVASTAGLKGYAYVAPYCAAKHGVIGLARALAQETARKGVTVNALCPGYTDTPLLEGAVRTIVDVTGRSADDARASLAAANPQGRLVRPDEVASAALWLCAPGADAITGQAFAIAGGEV